MRTRASPFPFDHPLAPDDVIDREPEAQRLVELADAGHNTVLYAPRRFGKTSLLGMVLDRAARELDMVPVLIDLSDVVSAADLAIRLRNGYRPLRGPVGRTAEQLLAALGLEVRAGPVVVRMPEVRARDPLETIHGLLDLPVKLHERGGRRVLVALDEFQALLALTGMDGVVRSHIQHHGDAASYIFSGSEPSLLRELFEDRARPLYGQAEQIRLNRLPRQPTADYIAERFADTGREIGSALGGLLDIAAGHPQRAMLLAHRIWERVEPGATADTTTLEVALEDTLRGLDAELRQLWQALSANERRVVVALAGGLSPYSEAAQRTTGLKRASSGQAAVETLLDRTVVDHDEHESLRIVDPMFVLWAQRRSDPRPTIYVYPSPDGSFEVADGPSRDFVRSRHPSLAEAEQAADHYAREAGGADLVVYDVDAGDELPDWAQGR